MAHDGALSGEGNSGNGNEGGGQPAQQSGTSAGVREPQPQPPPEQGKSFTQTDVDRLIAERLDRERKKYAGHDDLKAKAAKFDELEESKKSETQKLNDQLAAAHTELAGLRVEQVRREAAQQAGLPAELWEFVTEADPEAALAQATRVKQKFTPPELGKADLRQGSRPAAKSPASPNDALRALLGHP